MRRPLLSKNLDSRGALPIEEYTEGERIDTETTMLRLASASASGPLGIGVEISASKSRRREGSVPRKTRKAAFARGQRYAAKRATNDGVCVYNFTYRGLAPQPLSKRLTLRRTFGTTARTSA